jgi:hypothetical protein
MLEPRLGSRIPAGLLTQVTLLGPALRIGNVKFNQIIDAVDDCLSPDSGYFMIIMTLIMEKHLCLLESDKPE